MDLPPQAESGPEVPLLPADPPAITREEGSSTLAPVPEAEQKPPPRVYDLYSWRTLSSNCVLHYIREPEVLAEKLAELQPGPVGFDCEWKPTYVKGAKENPVALVQLACGDTVLLVQISAMRSFPQCLRDFLENTAFIKAGVGIQYDCRKLWNDYRAATRNCVDLSLLARTVDNARWKGKYSAPLGLARLCEAYHELTLNKGKVQRSNWEKFLNREQQEYAANDSHAGLTLYQKLHAMGTLMDPLPLPVWYSFDFWDGYLWQPSTALQPEILWEPHNPQYDPGPPPPPKPPKDPKDKKKPKEPKEKQSQGNGTDGTPAQAGNGRPPKRSHQASTLPAIGNEVPSNSVGHQQRGHYYNRGRGGGRGGGRNYHRLPNAHSQPSYGEQGPQPSEQESGDRGAWPEGSQGHPGRMWRPRRGGRGAQQAPIPTPPSGTVHVPNPS